MATNIYSSQIIPWPKPIYSVFSSLDIFSYLLGFTPAINPALLKVDLIDLGIRQAQEPLMLTEHFYQINNNFCICCKIAHYYTSCCLKTNLKTILHKIIVYRKEQFASLKAQVKLSTPSTFLLFLNLENLYFL